MSNNWLPLESGQIVWDPEFSLSSVEGQEAMMAFCDFDDEFNYDNWLRDFDDFLRYYVIDLVGTIDTSVLTGLPIMEPELFDKYLYRFATEDEYGKQRV